MRKFTIALLMLILLLGTCACSVTENAPEENNQTQENAPEENTPTEEIEETKTVKISEYICGLWTTTGAGDCVEDVSEDGSYGSLSSFFKRPGGAKMVCFGEDGMLYLNDKARYDYADENNLDAIGLWTDCGNGKIEIRGYNGALTPDDFICDVSFGYDEGRERDYAVISTGDESLKFYRGVFYVTSENIVGVWRTETTGDSYSYASSMTFNSDGTMDYIRYDENGIPYAVGIGIWELDDQGLEVYYDGNGGSQWYAIDGPYIEFTPAKFIVYYDKVG